MRFVIKKNYVCCCVLRASLKLVPLMHARRFASRRAARSAYVVTGEAMVATAVSAAASTSELF